ncbi:hypothetical protein H5410_062823 [Solanum commersonii]|uniref:Uncharacterized protein n=1 Tax=Solanum commersonii TaxID=4109 RepID=A0A9J5WBP5_SOLCO|nr:hypothetical protein H5410_062823 [Solanum commersonii]
MFGRNGIICFSIKNSHIQKMKILAEMRIVEMDTHRHVIVDIRDNMRVASVEDKMWEAILRWFRHVMRRCTYAQHAEV